SLLGLRMRRRVGARGGRPAALPRPGIELMAEPRRIRPWMMAGLGLAALLSVGWLAAGRGSAVPEADWLEVRRDDLVLSIPVTGSLEAVESVRLGPPAVPDTWD